MAVAPVLAIAAVAAAAGSAYVSYKSSTNQAKMGEQAQAIQRDQIASEAQTAALSAREQEAERQRRAGLTQAGAKAGAASAGLDYWLSPTAGTVDAENTRLAQGDLSAISLLGSAQQRRYALQDRGAAMAQQGYQAAGANAWISPTLSLLGSAAGAGASIGTGGLGMAGNSGVDARNAALSAQAASLAR